MFRVSYIDSNDQISVKSGFKSDKAAYEWVNQQGKNIVPLKLGVWSEYLGCYRTIDEF